MDLISGPGFLTSIVTAALSSTVAAEIRAWGPFVIRGLIKLAVGRLPENRRERFAEEWQSHVNDVPGQVGKLLVAIGFLVAAYDVALNELRHQMREAQIRYLAQLDQVNSTVDRVVNLIDDDRTLASEQSLTLHVNTLRSASLGLRNIRDRLAILIASPATLLDLTASSLSSLIDKALRRKSRLDRVSALAQEIMENGAKIVKHARERRG